MNEEKNIEKIKKRKKIKNTRLNRHLFCQENQTLTPKWFDTDTQWVSHLPKTSNSSVDRYCSAYNSSE